MLPGLSLAPRAVERPSDDGWTLLATLDGAAPARLDAGGLVSPEGAGWSLDWWIGADDRWYLPAREPSVRQRRIGAGPVIETTVRIPSGDARHVAYAAVVDGGPCTVIEITNDSPVPVALAMAIRPYIVGDAAGGARPDDALDAVRVIQLDDLLVRVGGTSALVLPRSPGQSGGSVGGDMLDAVVAGDDLAWHRSGPPLAPNGVVLYPLPHRTSLRFLIADIERASEGVRVDAAPDNEAVARGWTAVVERETGFELADPGLTSAVRAARARVLLAVPDVGPALAALRPGAGALLWALAAGGHGPEAERALVGLAESFPRRLGPASSPGDAAEIVAAAGFAATVLHSEPTLELIEATAQITHLVERSTRRRRLPFTRTPLSPAPPVATSGSTPAGASARATARHGLAALARLAGDVSAAAHLDTFSASTADPAAGARPTSHPAASSAPTSDPGAGLGAGSAPTSDPAADPAAGTAPTSDPAAGPAAGSGPTSDPGAGSGLVPASAGEAEEWLGKASAAGSWGADDPVAAARFVVAVRSLLVDDAGPGLVLAPGHRPAWRGGGTEVHRAPTRHGRLSFAIRWHGARPALLWELDPMPGAGPVAISCPALDPDWTTTDTRGETLLAGSSEPLPAAPMPGDSFT